MTDISTAEPPSPESESPARPGRARWPWFPFAWPAFLAGFCLLVWQSGADRGVVNSVVYVALGLTLVGDIAWVVRRSGFGKQLRWALAALAVTPMLLVAAIAFQVAPVQFVFDGDMGLVGWRWRGGEFSKQAKATDHASIPWKESPNDYPRFLGSGYWAEVHDVDLETDWKQHPPRLLWKQAIGAGWSGAAIVGDYLVTQEQRGPRELVVCYELRTGKVAWTHADKVRWDPAGSGALGGVGPRATPTAHDGKIFTQGATGIVNCLDARTGKRLWSHDTLVEHGVENIMWGKACSPLVVDDRVVVSVGGGAGASLIAYDIETGKQAWAAGDRRSSYASPVLTELGGVRQIVLVNEDAVTGHRADDGEVLWEHPWLGSSDTNASNSQPVSVGDDRLFLSKGYGEGAELIEVTADDDGKFASDTVWKDKSVMRTKMCNVVVRDGYVYGLNEGILQCIDLETGDSKWKKRRAPKFGHGQIMLIGDVILVLTEPGEVALIEASPKKYRELASMPAIEGITWNNPALAGPILFVRNAEEAACFELPLRNATGIAASHR